MKEHAARVLEERNRAFRVLYDTVIEVEGATDEQVYAIICRNLRKITNAKFAALASYDSNSTQLTLETIEPEECVPSDFTWEKRDGVPLSQCETDRFKRSRIKVLENTDPGLLDLPFQCGVRRPVATDDDKCYQLSCVRENELIAVCQVCLPSARKLKLKDIVDTYLNLAGMILQRVNAVRAMRESEEFVSTILNSMSVGVVVIDPDTHTVIEANSSVCELTGNSREQIIGHSCHRLICEARAGHCPITDLGQNVDLAERTLRRTSGETIPVLKSVVPVTRRGRKYLIETVTDIRERKRAEEEIRQAHEQTEQLLTSMSAILIGTDTQHTITRWNAAAAKTFGITADAAVGQPLRNCVADLEWEQLEQTLEDCCQTGESSNLDDIRFRSAEVGDRILSLLINRINHNADQPCPGMVIAGTDVTERRNLESQLEHARKMESVGQLAAGIAHEINTPTQYVSDNTRFLEDAFNDVLRLLNKYGDLLATSRGENFAPRMVAEVEAALAEVDIDFLVNEIPKAIDQSLDGLGRVARIVRAMKDFSHPGSDEKEYIDLNKAIEGTVTVAQNEWKYVADLVNEFDPALPLVPCHAGDINQVILNLIVNSSHAIADVINAGTTSRGKITISTRHDNGWAEIRVRDTGTGIPETSCHRVFDQFYTTKIVGKGTGQGLALAHNVIVEKHGGTITFETEMGLGTTFIIRLPLVKPASEQILPEALLAESSGDQA